MPPRTDIGSWRSCSNNPIITVAIVREWLGISPAGVNQIVSRLMDIGLLKEIAGYSRNRRFSFEPYLRLFEDS